MAFFFEYQNNTSYWKTHYKTDIEHNQDQNNELRQYSYQHRRSDS